MDENAISVQCKIEGCLRRVYRDVRCTQHGGTPEYEWSTDIDGRTTYYTRVIHQEGSNESATR